ncbi:hypothetical protein UA08_08223 [Talaromyces atroroseus]|uniref:Uncharacterized protein n=1 Tax=Talaromyces atroroseus TaxID=1441469 RepID=A0A225ASM5_TALAT|nr:hypothetical protein UA08_08223 [Talaromyces atroroseus]OKL56447.1 hypothetical protein UA08_08223 [Talaromyces atroroseus]
MDILRWRRKKEVSSRMDDRFGDPSISAPTQGSWNEMPPLRPVKTELAPTDKVGRFKSFLRSHTVDSPDYSISTVERANFPRHPMVDMQNHQRSVSVDRIQERMNNNSHGNGSTSRPRLSSSPQVHRVSSYDSLTGSDEDESEHNGHGRDSRDRRDRRDMVRHSRSRSQEEHWQAHLQHKAPHRNAQHKSPPLSSTAIMRRYSSQSESTRTYNSTPSTATFSSQHTSVTTPGLHGFSGSLVPPLLKEEEYYPGLNHYAHEPLPPIPSIRNNRAGTRTSPSSSPPSASNSASRGYSRGARSNKRHHTVPVGPQELVPSNDELWGY